jgi:hypothetical protein
MAHFAQLDETNIVTQVIVVNNNELLIDGVESEAKGIEFCQSLFGGNWVQTSYNKNFRKNYAGIGFIYDLTLDAFYAPQPYSSWVLDEDAIWQAPVAYPTDGKTYLWDETTLQWVEVTDTIETNQPDEADLTEGTN